MTSPKFKEKTKKCLSEMALTLLPLHEKYEPVYFINALTNILFSTFSHFKLSKKEVKETLNEFLDKYDDMLLKSEEKAKEIEKIEKSMIRFKSAMKDILFAIGLNEKDEENEEDDE